MAKKNNIPAVEAPVVEKPAAEEKKTPAVKTQIPGASGAMNQHDKVMYAYVLTERKKELKENGGSAEMYEGLTAIQDAVIIDVAVTELIIKKNPHALILTANEKNYNAVKLLAKEMGVDLPEFKTLPKPTKQEMIAAGLAGESTEGKVALRLEDKNVSSETKKKVKQEEAIRKEAEKADKEYLKDPTKIKTDEQLKEALGFQLVNLKVASPVDRLITAAQFLRSYREVAAEKSDDPQAELAKIHACTTSDFLQDIITMVPPSFALEGFGSHLCKLVASNNNVVPAYNIFRKAATKRNTNICKFSDEEIASLVRVIVVWNATAHIAGISNDLKILNKDTEKNAKAIAECAKKIEDFQTIIGYVTNPSFDIADNFLTAYNNKENEMHTTAIALFKSIISTYYEGVEIPELEFDTALLNVQQRVGIIMNLFTEDMLKRNDFSVENIVKLSTEEEAAAAEGKGESKNS